MVAVLPRVDLAARRIEHTLQSVAHRQRTVERTSYTVPHTQDGTVGYPVVHVPELPGFVELFLIHLVGDFLEQVEVLVGNRCNLDHRTLAAQAAQASGEKVPFSEP